MRDRTTGTQRQRDRQGRKQLGKNTEMEKETEEQIE